MQIHRFKNTVRLLTELQVDLISKENTLPSRARLRLLELVEKRLSRKELSLAVWNRMSIHKFSSSVGPSDQPPLTNVASDLQHTETIREEI